LLATKKENRACWPQKKRKQGLLATKKENRACWPQKKENIYRKGSQPSRDLNHRVGKESQPYFIIYKFMGFETHYPTDIYFLHSREVLEVQVQESP